MQFIKYPSLLKWLSMKSPYVTTFTLKNHTGSICPDPDKDNF